MHDIIAIIVAIIIIVLAVVFVVLYFVGKAKGVQSSIQFSDMMNANGSYYDPSLQYNITNHPVRNRILADAAVNPPSAPTKEQGDALRKQLNDWYNQASAAGKLKSMDKWGKATIEGAIDSAMMGNWPIGCVICYAPKGTEKDPSKWIELVKGGNRFFTRNPNDILATTGFVPRLASDCHAEMVVLDVFEDRLSKGMYDKTSSNYSMPRDSPVDFRKRGAFGYGCPDGIILFTQLNSCSMCMSRIGNSGIAADYFLGSDNAGGMQHRICDLPAAYENMADRQVHDVADVSPEMINFAYQSFAGPNGAWVSYATWKLGQLGSPQNLTNNYGYCKGMWFANQKTGANAVYDYAGWYRTVDLSKGPFLDCKVTPPTS